MQATSSKKDASSVSARIAHILSISNNTTSNIFCLQYIVKGAAKKVQDPGDPTKWFWSLSDEQFLEDWDLFEQEGGNYAHMIEPAAKRPADRQPFGGSEQNTHPTDPYPAQPSDRALEACMDNLAKQIFDLNHSLSLSHHADLNTTTMLRAMSRTKPTTTGGTTIAEAGSGQVVMADVHDSEEEFDPDGGDGGDVLNESAVIAEKLSESAAASRELTSSIREFIEEQRKRLVPPKDKEEEDEAPPSHVRPRGERAATRKEVIAEKEALKEVTGADNTPEARQKIATAVAALQDVSFALESDTPISGGTPSGKVDSAPVPSPLMLSDLHSPTTMAALPTAATPATVQVSTPPAPTAVTEVITPMKSPADIDSPTYEKNLALTRKHIESLGADWKERVRGMEEGRLEFRAADLAKIRREANAERAHARNADELADIDAKTAKLVDRVITRDQYLRRALQIAVAERQAREQNAEVALADSGTPVGVLDESSSSDTPVGVLYARMRMREMARAKTQTRDEEEIDSEGAKGVVQVLGFGDSEGSSANLVETSADRAFIVDDSKVEESPSSGSAQEDTGTITESSALADSLAEQASEIMERSSDADYQPVAEELIKGAVAAQKVATRASKKKEEELKKKVHFQ